MPRTTMQLHFKYIPSLAIVHFSAFGKQKKRLEKERKYSSTQH